jgi:penicillin-binding protein 1B
MSIEVVSVPENRIRFIDRVRRALRGPRRLMQRRNVRLALRVFGVTIVFAAGAVAYQLHASYTFYSQMIDVRLARGYLTSRAGIYAAPRTLRPGQALTGESLIALLRRAGYVESAGGDVWNGSFITTGGAVEIHPRHLADQPGPELVRVEFTPAGRVAQLFADGATVDAFTLEPEVLSNDASMKTGAQATLGFNDLPPVLVHAILSTEDRRYFEHAGVDLFGVGRALVRNVSDDRTAQGGSTITQQLVKNTYLSPERTLRRKYAEAILAIALERRLSKQDIFALYCNEVYLGQRGGAGVRGVAQAARVYFGKELKDLSLAEAATIAGMIQSPNGYAPDRHLEASLARRRTVLAGMARDGVITNEQAAAASQETLALAPVTGSDAEAPYFVDYVNRQVEQQLNTSGHADERQPRIYSTIDPDLQNLAETAIKGQRDRLDQSYAGRAAKPQVALVAIDPHTGNVLAMVGGRNYGESQMNRVTDAQRQPGSVFKPIVYAAALETNISPAEMYPDSPQEFTYDGNKKYRPVNYGCGFSGREVMMRDALVHSLNTVTVDVAMHTGLNRVSRVAADFGLPRPEPFPAEALGTTEATPLAVAAAYTTFVNGGVRVEPNVIARIDNGDGETLLKPEPRTRQVIEADTAYMITDMLQAVIEKGTAKRAKGAAGSTAIAGKTGTSHDSWFVGYTPNLVCAVWIGFDDNTELGLTGAEAALPVWSEFIKSAVDARPELGGNAFVVPAGIDFVQVDPETARLASPSCPQRETIAVTVHYAPHTECSKHFRPTADGMAVANSPDLTKPARPQSKPPATGSRSVPEPLFTRSTITEKSARGRSLLVSELQTRRNSN